MNSLRLAITSYMLSVFSISLLYPNMFIAVVKLKIHQWYRNRS